MKKKYKIDYINGVASRISVKTDIPNYTVGVLEPFFPSEDELKTWKYTQHQKWIRENNKLLKKVCMFLNNKF